ncbi:hypothetical protein BW723_06630 [Polaribacter reichenbachii]|uniref:Uncharacterized protein n=1 Tax=Polaribacter reichenbachii TaxID=996801 RepID=A0A1B8U607_9FLAO|nr:hypothetical protein [Polaribacter reichenbachii]APZ45988.1 hypothetical protein BW723_06630 [Polaribacter reichenbachii]AUC19850.1 hypothetical protein BTO17_14650 [Polaribacter reichenbachii]OBY67295.1 hypothetical protein LPB301_02860 [Polaribacter reichenbachii]
MYTLTVKNNYVYDIGSSNGVTIAKSGNHVFNNRGSIYFTIPGIGEISFIDLGDKKIEGYPIPKETWGVLIRAQTTEAYYRYEGGGELTATLDSYGTLHLSTTNGTMIAIRLPELIIN